MTYFYWNKRDFGDDERKVMFMISYMRGDVYAWVLPKLKDYFEQGTKFCAINKKCLLCLFIYIFLDSDSMCRIVECVSVLLHIVRTQSVCVPFFVVRLLCISCSVSSFMPAESKTG